ncbi:hypothetical protein, partial [Lonsdalea populi]
CKQEGNTQMINLFNIIDSYEFDPQGNPRDYIGPDGKDYSYEEAAKAGLFDRNEDSEEVTHND